MKKVLVIGGGGYSRTEQNLPSAMRSFYEGSTRWYFP